MATIQTFLTNGTVADASDVMSNENEIFSNIDPSNVQPANKTGTGPFVLGIGATLTNPVINGVSFAGSTQLVPIGSIIPFYDFSALITFDTSYWTYCNGAILVNASSPLNGQTLPDLSGRYLVGFGNDGGGNIGTAPWTIVVAGNAGHQINLLHSHTVAGHTHTVAAHHHTISNSGTHTHSITSGGPVAALDTNSPDNGVIDPGGNHNHGGITGDTSPITSSVSPGTDSQLSATQSIQPRSIRVRYIMRVQ